MSAERVIITASLEGMRVVIDEKQCELQEYNFTSNRWFSKDTAAWSLTRSLTDTWLAGWNDVDRFAAVTPERRTEDAAAVLATVIQRRVEGRDLGGGGLEAAGGNDRSNACEPCRERGPCRVDGAASPERC